VGNGKGQRTAFLRGIARSDMLKLQLAPNEEHVMIKKAKGGYKVVSKKGKNLGGPYKSKAKAKERLRQVEFFKRNKG
jgi:hypothetical protein